MGRFESTSSEVLVGEVSANQPFRKLEVGSMERHSW